MLFIARFHDKEGIAEKRAELLDAHFKWLDANRDRVLLAGAVRTDVDGTSLGGLWIIEADSKADVEKVFQGDPFFANGLRERVEIFYYARANPDRTVTF